MCVIREHAQPDWLGFVYLYRCLTGLNRILNKNYPFSIARLFFFLKTFINISLLSYFPLCFPDVPVAIAIEVIDDRISRIAERVKPD